MPRAIVIPRYVIRRIRREGRPADGPGPEDDGPGPEDGGGPEDAGALYDLPYHGQVCLHTEDAGIVGALESSGHLAPAGHLAPRRPPYLDAARGGVHGGYRPRPQINVFFRPPIEAVAEAITPPLQEAGYTVSEASAHPPA
ncbi:MAG TPA: hypothetical protein VM737_08150 [Gemmatimonadota bacterium]|nr:hypothetical protein [Gemmatimonadota bacterium]